MPTPNDLLAILDHIASSMHTEFDIAILRVLLTLSNSQDLLQLGKYGINTEQGQDIYVGDRIYQDAGTEATLTILQEILQFFQINTQAEIRENLPPSMVVQFVGREREVIILHQQLQDNKRAAVSAIAGMDGVGKSELALQYAQIHKQTYRAGICWFQTRGVGVGPQILQFGQNNRLMRLELPMINCSSSLSAYILNLFHLKPSTS